MNNSNYQHISVDALERLAVPCSDAIKVDTRSIREEFGESISPDANILEHLTAEYAGDALHEIREFTVQDLINFLTAWTDGRLIDRSALRTDRLSYYFLDPEGELAHSVQYHYHNFPLLNLDRWICRDNDLGWGARLRHGFTPFAAGIIKEGNLHSDLHPGAFSDDLFLEVHHPISSADSEVDNYCTNVLFELAAHTEIVFRRASYPEFIEFLEEPQIELPEKLSASNSQLSPISVSPFSNSNHLRELWLRASQTSDAELAFIQYTRCIEYVATTVVRVKEHEQLRTLLSMRNLTEPDAQHLDSIISLVDQFAGKKQKDKEMVRETIATCCVPELLPDEFSLVFPRMAKLQANPNARLRQELLLSLGTCIYDTRNSLVHAKPNYSPTGNEIDNISPGVIKTMRIVALCAIRWFSRQPSHMIIS